MRSGWTRSSSTILLLVMLLSSAMLIMPSASADKVNVFSISDTTGTATAGDTTMFEWVLYNNDTVPYVVMFSTDPESSSDITITTYPSHITLDPDDSATFMVNVTTAKEMGSETISIDVELNITQLDNATNTQIVGRAISLKVDPIYGTSAGDNKILGKWDNNLPSPLDGNLGAFLVSVGIWGAIALFILMVADPIMHLVTSKTTTDLDDIILKILRIPVLLIIILFGAVSSLEILNLDRTLVANLETLYSIAMIFIISWLLYKIYDGVIIYYGHKLSLKTDSEVDDVLIPVMQKLGMILIPVGALMAVLNMFGYDLTVILAGLGFMGIVVGYAAQATLANFFAGLQLMADRPFKIGDLLRQDNGDICEVRRIGMRSTTLYNTFTHELMIVPNDTIANKNIVNMVLPDRKLKIAVMVGVAYGSDVELVKKLMVDAALSTPDVLSDEGHETVIRFSDFADSSLNFTAFIWVTDLDKQFKVASDYRSKLLEIFNQHNIDIPFPQTVVWLRDFGKNDE